MVTSGKESETKVLVIGLDGATWDLIIPWIREGKLPTFKKLMDNGVYGTLKSTIPPWTVPAWNCMLTGKNPGRLGVFSFITQREPGSYEFRPYFFINKPKKNTIVDILSKYGKTVCSINIPTTHYAYEINGCMVAGWLYHPSKPLTYPKELKSELDDITNGYEIDVEKSRFIHGEGTHIENTEKFLRDLYRITEKRAKATEYLLDKYNWDFFFVVFTGTDRIQHELWENKKEIKRYYQYIDKIIAKLLNKIGNDVILILVSDHGFGPNSRVFNINEWLIEKELLKLKNLNIKTKMRRILGKLHLWNLGKYIFPASFRGHIGGKMQTINFEEANIDWNRTKAYTLPLGVGEIFINLKGREPDGIIEPGEEYEELRDWIIKELKKLSVFDEKESIKVFKREEIYFGEYVNCAPDLIIQVNNNICGINTRIGYGSIFSDGKGGNHRINGIFLAYGPDIKKGWKIKDAEIVDIAPTILHIMRVPIPKDMDGRVLKEIFKENSELAKRRIIYQETVDERDRIRKSIKELKALRGE